jgi:hypothetical protein
MSAKLGVDRQAVKHDRGSFSPWQLARPDNYFCHFGSAATNGKVAPPTATRSCCSGSNANPILLSHMYPHILLTKFFRNDERRPPPLNRQERPIIASPTRTSSCRVRSRPDKHLPLREPSGRPRTLGRRNIVRRRFAAACRPVPSAVASRDRFLCSSDRNMKAGTASHDIGKSWSCAALRRPDADKSGGHRHTDPR